MINTMELIILMLFTVLASLASFFLLTYLRRYTRNNIMVKSLVDVSCRPLPWMILIAGLIGALGAGLGDYSYLQKNLLQVRYLFLVGACAYLLFRWKRSLEFLLLNAVTRGALRKQDREIFAIASKLISVMLGIGLSIVILDSCGISWQALCAFGGLSGIAISFAAKDIVGHFFAGIMVYVNRPFVPGDSIKSPNKQFEGIVEDVGWYMTKIITPERKLMYIPNSMITDAMIENSGTPRGRSVRLYFTIFYQDAPHLEALTKNIYQMIKSNSAIDASLACSAFVTKCDGDALYLEVCAFTTKVDAMGYFTVQQELVLGITHLISAQGIRLVSTCPGSSLR